MGAECKVGRRSGELEETLVIPIFRFTKKVPSLSPSLIFRVYIPAQPLCPVIRSQGLGGDHYHLQCWFPRSLAWGHLTTLLLGVSSMWTVCLNPPSAWNGILYLVGVIDCGGHLQKTVSPVPWALLPCHLATYRPSSLLLNPG